jgi:protein TonB
MAKDVNLTSQEWCDIVFEGKNKEYGAYTIRRSSSRRHLIALIAIFVIAIFIAILPTLVKKISEAVARSISEGLNETTVLAQLENTEDQEEEQNQPKYEEPPPPPLKSTIKFTPPVIVDSKEMTDEDQMKRQDELIDTKTQISVADIVGTDEEKGIDVADLKQNQEIVQETKEVIHQFVDQMPDYPGGMQELYAYIRKHTQYPEQARNNNIQGTTVVKFVVTKSGSVEQVHVLTSSHPFLDKEAIRVVQTLPKWIPGKMNGVNVSCWYNLPVTFTLQ